ncbi:MAG: prepilin peptidase [Planctomycetaceae bacterium]|nr:prepilin peptidase [Planctomycetaceae bacterium]
MALFVDLPAWLIFPFLFALGATIGSFLNVVILRSPWKATLWEQWASLSDHGSHCPRCKADIRWYDNIPIFGWLKLGGKCRNCRLPISPRYPIIELLNACLFVLVYWLEVPVGMNRALQESCLYTPLGPWTFPGLGGMSPELALHLQYLFHMVLIESLLVASVIDLDHRIIPEISTTPVTVFGVVFSAAVARVHLAPVWYQSATLERDFGILLGDRWRSLLDLPAGATVDGPIWVPAWISQHPYLHGLVVSLAGAAMGYALIKLVRELGNWVMRREAMGIGDIYLMIAIGAFLGWQATLVAFFLAPLWGLLFYGVQRLIYPDEYIPYGPFLSLGALLTLLCWNGVFERTHRIFELGPLLLPLAVLMVGLLLISLLLTQAAKWLVGIPLYPEEAPLGDWTAADQTAFFAGEFVNRWTGRWKIPDWEGNASGRGQIHEDRWRQGASPSKLQPPKRL